MAIKQLGNIQNRSFKNEAEVAWENFGKQLQMESTRSREFSYNIGTSKNSGNGVSEHMDARNAPFDFVFNFTGYDTQVYENMPGYIKGKFTGRTKEWMWSHYYSLNIEVKRVGMGSLASVMPKRFVDSFGIPWDQRNRWLIVDHSNIVKLRNFGGIIYILEKGEEEVHHIFGSHIIDAACFGEYFADWEGDPTSVGGGGYKMKTLLDKSFSLKFKTFKEVELYIRKVAEIKMEKEKQANRLLFKKNIEKKSTSILPYSNGKAGSVKPVVCKDGRLVEAPQKAIQCRQVGI